MRLGFTGTRQGLTDPQREALETLLRSLKDVAEAHHGDAVGADAEFSLLLRACHLGAVIFAHPCDIPSQRSQKSTWHRTHPPKPPLARNRDIVDASDLLVACPAGMAEERRSGTWATVRHARRKGVPLRIVRPDGTVTEEDT
jgi:hypothetical protein